MTISVSLARQGKSYEFLLEKMSQIQKKNGLEGSRVLNKFNNGADLSSESHRGDMIKDLLLKVRNEDGSFDFGKFKKLYTTKYVNEDLRNQSSPTNKGKGLKRL